MKNPRIYKSTFLGWRITLAILFVLFSFSSCLKEYKDAESFELESTNQDFSVALVNTRLSIQNALEELEDQSYLNIDQDEFISLVYFQDIESLKAEEFVQLENFIVPAFDTLSIIPIDPSIIPIDLALVELNAGKLKVSFRSSSPEDLEVQFKINNLTENGSVFTFQKTVTVSGMPPIDIEEIVDIGDYILDLQNDEFVITYSSRTGTGEHRYLENILFEFHDLEPGFVQGYFGTNDVNLVSDTLSIDLFENIPSGNIDLEDPQIRLISDNEIGIPFSITSKVFEADSKDNLVIELVSDLKDGITIQSPSIDEVGASKQTIISFGKDNSNLAELINSKPSELRYELDVKSNPEENPAIENFIETDSELKLRLEVEIPLWLEVRDVLLEDTLDLDLDIPDEIISAEFKLKTINTLPLDIALELILLDENGVVLDDILSLDTRLIKAGVTNSNGVVDSPRTSEVFIPLEETKLLSLKNAKQILMRGTLSTEGASPDAVKFFTNYDLQVQLGVQAIIDLDNGG